MRKDITLLEAMRLTGKDAYELIGVNKTTKQWIKRSVNTTIGSNALVQAMEETIEIEEVSIVEPIVEITSIDKPSDRFDVEDYIRYEEYMISNGGVPSIKDYFEATAYYMNGGR